MMNEYCNGSDLLSYDREAKALKIGNNVECDFCAVIDAPNVTSMWAKELVSCKGDAHESLDYDVLKLYNNVYGTDASTSPFYCFHELISLINGEGARRGNSIKITVAHSGALGLNISNLGLLEFDADGKRLSYIDSMAREENNVHPSDTPIDGVEYTSPKYDYNSSSGTTVHNFVLDSNTKSILVHYYMWDTKENSQLPTLEEARTVVNTVVTIEYTE